jgi:hypothetical protein
MTAEPARNLTGLPDDEEHPRAQNAMTVRQAAVAIGIGAASIAVTAAFIRYTEMRTGRYISDGVPPIPAFASLLIFGLIRALLIKRAPRFAPTQAQILLIYVMLTIGTILSGPYQIRAFLPHLVSLQYWGRDGRVLGQYVPYLPSWYAPRNPDAIRRYFEGSRSGEIPWSYWAVPLFWWSLFFLAVFLCVYAMISLIRNAWIRNERLSFPLLSVPLAMTVTDWSAFGNRRQRTVVFAFGFAVAFLFNGINILHVLVPSIPSLGFYSTLQDVFHDKPWTAFNEVYFIYFLEAIGIGYFVPLEITFSVWFFYLLNRLLAAWGMSAGYDTPGFPFTQEQSAGGYIAMGLILLFGLRQALRASFKLAFTGRALTPEARRERGNWLLLTGGAVFVLAFCRMAGFSLLLAVPFFGILAIFTLVFARIRAETGVPFSFIYPFGLPKDLLVSTLGVQNVVGLGGTGSFVLFSSMAWLSRHHYPEEMAAYQMDGAKIAESARIPRRALFMGLLSALIVGLLCAYWVHLSAYYSIGSNMAGGSDGSGEFRATIALTEYQHMASSLATPPPPQLARFWAALGGFGFVGIISFLRMRIVGFPLHPLGFLIATAYGDGCNSWFSLFIAWLCKSILLKLGGLNLYRRGMPFFLGLTIGHFFMAGIAWPFISLFLPREVSNGYHIWFGG